MRFELDYVLVGGGLQNGLVALALLARRPGIRLALIEREGRLGGNHTWCFHAADVPAEAAGWIEPLIVKRWPGYEVCFFGGCRSLSTPYAAISSERFDHVLRERLDRAPGCALIVDGEAVAVEGNVVKLADGRVLTAATVIDARGPAPRAGHPRAGFQKFVGLEVKLVRGAPPRLPVVMDARVSQEHGFHFAYLLPFDSHRLLVEDTLFADEPRLDREAMRAAALRHLDARSLVAGEVLREESGVLPMPWAGNLPAPGGGPLLAGARGGWFHPGTGYSFPLALRLARLIAEAAPAPPRADDLDALCRATRRQVRFVQWLNWMLFRVLPPAQRWRVLAHFYALPEDLIARYYALDLSLVDRARILFHGNPLRAGAAGRCGGGRERGSRSCLQTTGFTPEGPPGRP